MCKNEVKSIQKMPGLQQKLHFKPRDIHNKELNPPPSKGGREVGNFVGQMMSKNLLLCQQNKF